MNGEISRPNPGPFDTIPFPPKWAFDPISNDEYEQQKAEHYAKQGIKVQTCQQELEDRIMQMSEREIERHPERRADLDKIRRGQ